MLTEREVADLFRVTRRTVQRWAAAGTLEAIRVGGITRYRTHDVEALLGPLNDDAPGGRTQGVGKASDVGARLAG